MSTFEEHRQASIAQAIAKVDFPQIAQTALERWLNGRVAEGEAQLGPAGGSNREVKVVVLTYGFAWNNRVAETACR